MHVAHVAVLLLLLTAGCTHVGSDPPASETEVLAAQPGTPQPAATPAEPATPQPEPAAAPAPGARTPAPQVASRVAPPVAKTPAAAPAPSAKTPAPQVAGKVAPPIAKTPAAVPPLDLNALEEGLKATKAIGVFAKITLRNQVDDLLDQFREYYQGKAKLSMTDLRRSYDVLMMKVLSLLQDEDQKLASAIVSSREAIWGMLADREKFATLQG